MGERGNRKTRTIRNRQYDRYSIAPHTEFGELPLAAAKAKITGPDALPDLAWELWSKVVFGVRQGFEGGGGLAENVACLE